jgi:hypothetical protein
MVAPFRHSVYLFLDFLNPLPSSFTLRFGSPALFAARVYRLAVSLRFPAVTVAVVLIL